MTKNIAFVYSYTDHAGVKNTAELVFPNPEGIRLGEVEYQVKSRLINLEYFHHSDLMVPSLFGEYPDMNVNPHLHAFEKVYETDNESTDKRSISDFLQSLK